MHLLKKISNDIIHMNLARYFTFIFLISYSLLLLSKEPDDDFFIPPSEPTSNIHKEEVSIGISPPNHSQHDENTGDFKDGSDDESGSSELDLESGSGSIIDHREAATEMSTETSKVALQITDTHSTAPTPHATTSYPENTTSTSDPFAVFDLTEDSVEFPLNLLSAKEATYWEGYYSMRFDRVFGKALLKSIPLLAPNLSKIHDPNIEQIGEFLEATRKKFTTKSFFHTRFSSNLFIDSFIAANYYYSSVIISPDTLFVLFLQNLSQFSMSEESYQALPELPLSTRKTRILSCPKSSSDEQFINCINYKFNIQSDDMSIWTQDHQTWDKNRKTRGLKSIILIGKTEEWEQLEQIIKHFTEVHGEHFQSWLNNFITVFEIMKASRTGNIDFDFWENFMKVDSVTDENKLFIQGHVLNLFAFLSGGKRNPYLDDAQSGTLTNKEELLVDANDFPRDLFVAGVVKNELSDNSPKPRYLVAAFTGVTVQFIGQYILIHTGWFVLNQDDVQYSSLTPAQEKPTSESGAYAQPVLNHKLLLIVVPIIAKLLFQ